MNSLLFALKNVFRNSRRASVTILITAIGTAAIMIGGGFAHFTYQGLQELATRDSGHLIIGHEAYFEREEETPLELGLAAHRQIAQLLQADPRVKTVLPRVKLSGLISNGEKSAIFTGTGIDPEEFVVKGGTIGILAGEPLSRKTTVEEIPEVMLAVDLAKRMGAEVGTILTLMGTTSEGVLNAIDVAVKGIIATGVPELDKRVILTHLTTAQVLLDSNKVSSLHLYLHQTKDTDPLLAELRESQPQYAYQSWLDQAFFYIKVKGLYNRIFGILGLIILFLVFFSVSNTMSMVVIERTREIGTQAALGAYPSEIVRNFSLEALLIALIGGAIGVLFGAATSIGLQFAGIEMPPPPGRTDGYPLEVHFSPELAALVVPLMIIVCVVAAWSAARRGVKKPIVEALAHV